MSSKNKKKTQKPKRKTIQEIIDTLITNGNDNFNNRNLVEAVIEYSRALDHYNFMENYYHVQKQEVLVRTAVCFDLLGNPRRAEELISQALDVVPNIGFLILYKTILLLVNGSTEEANLLLIKYKQVSFNFKDNKSCLTYETFRLLFYFLMGFESSVILKEIEEVAEKYSEINSILLLLRASIHLKIFSVKHPEYNFSFSEECDRINSNLNSNNTNTNCTANSNLNSKISRLTVNNINLFTSSSHINNNINNNFSDNINNNSYNNIKLIKIQSTDTNYIQFKNDIELIGNIEQKDTASFLLREGISLDTLTKLFFLSVPEMEKIEPRKLTQYSRFNSGFKLFYVLFKVIKLFKFSLKKKSLKAHYKGFINQIVNSTASSNTNTNTYLTNITNITYNDKSMNTMRNNNSNNWNINNSNISNIDTVITEINNECKVKIKELYNSSAFLMNQSNNKSNNNINTNNSNINESTNKIMFISHKKQESDASKTNLEIINDSSLNKHNNNTDITQITHNLHKDKSTINMLKSKKEISLNYFIKNNYYSHSNINSSLIKYYNKTVTGDASISINNANNSINKNTKNTSFRVNQSIPKSNNTGNTLSNYSEERNNNKSGYKNVNYTKSNIVNSNNNSKINNIVSSTNDNLNDLNLSNNLLSNCLVDNFKVMKKNNKNVIIENNNEKVRLKYKELLYIIHNILYYCFILLGDISI